MATVLSPKISELALDGFRAALGAEAVLTGEEELRDFRDPFAFPAWDEYTASAVLMPQTVEEIQQVVRVANEHKVPLWTHSTGMNNGSKMWIREIVEHPTPETPAQSKAVQAGGGPGR